ncbi:MAG: ATP-binding protein [Betaproteobacteria bacterium]|jgi:signal transduction histidine kinase|nr:ATP-binding protein [Rubrivivax sp.]
MTKPPGLEASDEVGLAIQREMLQVALRNSARSVGLLMAAVLYMAWLGWHVGRPWAAALVLVLGSVVSAWRWHILARWSATADHPREDIQAAIRQLEANALVGGVMWSVATVFVYPMLQGPMASTYVIAMTGSVAVAALFMAMAGKAFKILLAFQVLSLALVSLLVESVQSVPMAVLALLTGATMLRATREFREVNLASLRDRQAAEHTRRSLERAVEEARAADAAKSQFLATMSHEIRTPMNGVLGAMDLLKETALDGRQRRLVRTAAQSGESLMEILNDVLDHSKIEAGKLVLAPSPTSLHSVAMSAAALFRARAETKGLTLALQIDPEVPDGVVTDGPRLKQVLLNLLSNAVKFTERGGITLRLALQASEPSAARVRIEVQDSGVGIPAGEVDRVFQPFTQFGGTRSRLSGGTGLGLSISQRIIEALGGRIEVTSRVGGGSCFWFTLFLPLAPETPPRPSDSDFAALDSADRMEGVVLLVEDNEVNRLIGSEMLRSFGLEVKLANDGQQALQLLEQHRVDLVLMDIGMPVLDGHEATRRLREREQRLKLPRVPVVALTAYAFESDAAKALDAGMDAHLAKPYSREQLKELVQRWL